MTSEEMERALIVQGELMHRVEQAVAQNTEAIAQNTEAIAQNTKAIAHNTEAIGKLSDGMLIMQDGMLIMQGAMKSLFERMDRFIRGLESDGHQRGGA
jgi:ABC-type transporter Mla maintaining outer membrane lipid asymmetry ATPase subunit MlaF